MTKETPSPCREHLELHGKEGVQITTAQRRNMPIIGRIRNEAVKIVETGVIATEVEEVAGVSRKEVAEADVITREVEDRSRRMPLIVCREALEVIEKWDVVMEALNVVEEEMEEDTEMAAVVEVRPGAAAASPEIAVEEMFTRIKNSCLWTIVAEVVEALVVEAAGEEACPRVAANDRDMISSRMDITMMALDMTDTATMTVIRRIRKVVEAEVVEDVVAVFLEEDGAEDDLVAEEIQTTMQKLPEIPLTLVMAWPKVVLIKVVVVVVLVILLPWFKPLTAEVVEVSDIHTVAEDDLEDVAEEAAGMPTPEGLTSSV
jgi:hypothetical protein